MKRLIIRVMVLLVIVSNFAFAEKNSNYFINIGGGLNTNIYSADFVNLPGFTNNCAPYNPKTGFSYNMLLGGEYLFKDKIFGLQSGIGLNLSISDLSAKLSNETFRGWVILADNTTKKAYIGHDLTPSIVAFGIEPEYFVRPVDKIPLNVSVGLNIAFPLKKDYAIEDKIKRPDELYTENGDKTLFSANSSIPNFSSMLFSLAIGAKYTVYQKKNFAIQPQIKYNLGLNNVIDGLNWKINSLQTSIVLSYNLPMPSPEAPKLAPEAPLPLPKSPDVLSADFYLTENDKVIRENQTIYYDVVNSVYEYKYEVLPLLFAEDINNNNINDKKLSSKYYNAYSFMVDNIAKHLLADNNEAVTLLSNGVADESKDDVYQRAELIKKELIDKGVAEDKIKIETIISDKKKFRYAELKAEAKNIKFVFTSGIQTLPVNGIEKSESNTNDLSLYINTDIKSSAGIKSMSGEISLNNQKYCDFSTKTFNLNIKSKDLLAMKDTDSLLTIKITSEDLSGNKVEKTKSYKLNAILKQSIDGINTNAGKNDYSEYMLGFNSFDKAELFTVNQFALSEVQKAIASGKHVILYPLTDSLGSEEHNKKLADKRANFAIKYLKLQADKIDIVYPNEYNFQNNTSLGRVLNRGILIRIKK